MVMVVVVAEDLVVHHLEVGIPVLFVLVVKVEVVVEVEVEVWVLAESPPVALHYRYLPAMGTVGKVACNDIHLPVNRYLDEKHLHDRHPTAVPQKPPAVSFLFVLVYFRVILAFYLIFKLYGYRLKYSPEELVPLGKVI